MASAGVVSFTPAVTDLIPGTPALDIAAGTIAAFDVGVASTNRATFDGVTMVMGSNTAGLSLGFQYAPTFVASATLPPSEPVPFGIWPSDIEGAARFGKTIAEEFPQREAGDTRPMLRGLGAVVIHPGLISSEQIVQRSFRIWGKLLRACGKPGSPLRRAVLGLYVVFLVAMLLTIVPVVFVLKTLLSPLTRNRVAAQRNFFAAPSGE